MEEPVQPRSLKLTIKVKSNKNVTNHPAATDPVNNVAGEVSASSSPHQPCSMRNSSQDQVKLEGTETNRTENGENQSSDNSQYQLVLYDPTGNSTDAAPMDSRTPPLLGPRPFLNQAPKVSPSVGAFTVQCANCFKWRLIPTKEKYEEIREHIIEQPFSCDTAREWRPEISCDDPPDIMQDGSRLWAIDKPSIAQPPPGWQRLLHIRSEGGSRFADVYYVAPSGKRLRSTVEVQKYLSEHPEYVGISISRFSFQIPRPLQDNYVKKRPRDIPDDFNDHGGPAALPSAVEPLSWASPDVDTDLQLKVPGLSKLEVKSAKKKKSSSSKKKLIDDLVHDQNVFNME